MIKDTEFPRGFRIGPTTKVLGFATGGSAGDWINTQLKIPAAEIEIGAKEERASDWMPISKDIAFKQLNESWVWLLSSFKHLK